MNIYFVLNIARMSSLRSSPTSSGEKGTYNPENLRQERQITVDQSKYNRMFDPIRPQRDSKYNAMAKYRSWTSQFDLFDPNCHV